MNNTTLLAWRNLKGNRARSLFSVLAVMLAVAVTIATTMVAGSVRNGIIQSEELRITMGGLIDMLNPMMSFIGLIILLASGFLIFNTFNMGITRQRQMIGSLRSLGTTRGQIRRIVLTEALIIALVGVVLGVLVSVPLGNSLVTVIKQIAGEMLAFGEALPSIETVLGAAIGGFVVTLLSAWLPARRATQIAPLDALRQPEASQVQGVSRLQTALALVVSVVLLVGVMLVRPGEVITYPMDGLLTMFLVVVWCWMLAWLLPLAIRLMARLLGRLDGGATVRLISDNLQRARSRVTSTALSFMLSLLVLIGLTGFLQFFLIHGMVTSMQGAEQQGALFVGRIDVASGWGNIMARGLDTILLTDEELEAVMEAMEGDAQVAPVTFTTIPELSFMGDAYFTFMMNPTLVRAVGDLFTFTEGDWDTALPIMQAGCGALVAPAVAQRNNVTVGDTLPITVKDGAMMDCTIAGIGQAMVNVSIVSDTFAEQITDVNPLMVFMVPNLGVSTDELESRIVNLQDSFPELSLTRFDTFLGAFDEALAMISVSMNMMLMLALVAAAMSVINTLLISVEERRREIGLLRAVGTTRQQMRRVIVGEAVLIGVVGGVMGVIAGLGVIAIIVLTYGLNSFGVQADLWAVMLDSVNASWLVVLFGLLVAPLIAMVSAWLPARGILRETPVASLALR
jgi:putative ABC transport system permease protein